jgi:hypothetical protein
MREGVWGREDPGKLVGSPFVLGPFEMSIIHTGSLSFVPFSVLGPPAPATCLMGPFAVMGPLALFSCTYR